MPRRNILLSSVLLAALALTGCGGDASVADDHVDEIAADAANQSADGISTTLAAAASNPNACDLDAADGSATLSNNTTVRKNTTNTYGTASCPRYKLDVKNRAADGLPITEKVDVTTRYSGAVPTTQAACEGLGLAVSMRACTSASCDPFLFDAFSILGVWNGTSCRVPSVSRAVFVGAKTYRLTATTTDSQNRKQFMTISFTPI